MKTFDPDLHVYGVNAVRVPGATDVIKAERLINTDWMSDDSRWRGKCVHRGIELFLRNELDWDSVDADAGAEPIKGYLKSFEHFLRVTGFEVVGAESPCFDDAFACIPDVWGRLNKQNVIIELKTGMVPKWAAIQTALQQRALRRHFGFLAVKRFGLRLLKDGTISKLVPFENPRDESSAMAMVESFWWKKQNGYLEDIWQAK